MRVVLDTNVLFSGLVSRENAPGQLLMRWRGGRFQIVSCEEQIDEIRRVSRYAKMRGKFFPSEAGRLVSRLREHAVIIDSVPQVDVSRDPWDNYLLALADAGRADYLVTGDKRDLLALKRYAQAQIITVRELLDRL